MLSSSKYNIIWLYDFIIYEIHYLFKYIILAVAYIIAAKNLIVIIIY